MNRSNEMTACGNNVLIRVNANTDEEMVSGIVVPAGSEPQAIGEVLSVGPGAYKLVQPGELVLFQPFRAIESWREDSDTIVIVEDNDIFAVIQTKEVADD